MSAQQKLLAHRIIPVVEVEQVEHAVPLAEALLAGGISIVEVTLRTAAAIESIQRIHAECPDMFVGAGTVLTVDQAQAALNAGAAFGVAPGCNPLVVQCFEQAAAPFVPGANTPTEIEAAAGLGCKLLKFFPAEAAGGVKYLNALAGPYQELGIRFCATGGVGPANLAEYLGCKLVAAVGGSWIATRAQIKEGDWTAIRAQAEQSVIASRQVVGNA